MASTYIVTLEFDAESFDWLNALRQAHFPVERNFLDAHLTLFHKVDIEGFAAIERHLAQSSVYAFPLSFAGLRSLGRGVAIEVAAPELMTLRADLTRFLAGRLTAQDQQTYRPHVTIQNKVGAVTARGLLVSLQATFAPREGQGVAVLIWEYLGGPWRLAARLPLRNDAGPS